MPNHDQVSELYKGKIFTEEHQLALKERIFQICSRVQGKKILDIGCSQGIISLILAKEGHEVIGVDNEQPSLEYARKDLQNYDQQTIQKVKFLWMDANKLDFQKEIFDTVILGEILEHLVKPEAVLSEVQRVLKKEGVTIITVPFGFNNDPDHKKHYYPTLFVELVSKFFHISELVILENYLLIKGTKQIKKSPSDSKTITLAHIKQIEQRCFAFETKCGKLTTALQKKSNDNLILENSLKELKHQMLQNNNHQTAKQIKEQTLKFLKKKIIHLQNFVLPSRK